jgi:hypothetical protein
VTRYRSISALAAVVALTLVGCGGGSGSSEPTSGGSDSSSTTSTQASGSTSASGNPTGKVDGVSLTPEGTRLKVGQTARVSWQPDQKTTGVVALTVTGLLEMPISAFSAWRLKNETRRSTPYFVHVSVRNLGKSDLSGVAVPLYLLDQRGTLLQASRFQAPFAPCPSRPLPNKFGRGDKTDVCLVYFAPDHGKLVAISFRPTEDFDAITWAGTVVTSGGRHHQNHQNKHQSKH